MINSLKQEVDPSTLAAEAIMLRAASPANSLLLLEGAHDEKLFLRFMNQEKCEIIICYGRENAIETLNRLETLSVDGVLCIVDSDFSMISADLKETDNLIFTDDHDIEIMMFSSGAFDLVISEFGSQNKIKRLIEAGVDIRKTILRAAYPIGRLRLYSKEKNIGLKFEGLSFSFVDRKTLEVDIKRLVQAVYNNTRRPLKNFDELSNLLKIEEENAYPLNHICCGHDVCTILGRALIAYIGNQTSAITTIEMVERWLRLAYSENFFKKTALFQKIKAWEIRNNPFVCLLPL
jgi:hypothetical protein